jgi:hypothetical protein
MSKLFEILFLQFLTCNSWLAILDLQFLTCISWLAILDKWEQNTMCHGKAQNVPREGTKCATGRHKMCHSTAQNVPQHGINRLMCHGKAQNVPYMQWHKKTLRLMCHRTVQNVPQDGTKCATARHKKTYVPRESGRYKMCHSTAQKERG